MELVKPEPLIIGGRAQYTLTSYEPVVIEVDVPYTTEEDIEYALQIMVMQEGGSPANMHDDAWIREHFEGIEGLDELRVVMGEQVRGLNAQMAEQQKAAKCMEVLAGRLVQRVPRAQVAQARTALVQNLAMSLRQDGLSEADFLAQTGMSHHDLEAMFDQQAEEAAQEEAAIDAWIASRKLVVNDDELPRLLGLPVADVEKTLADARAAGGLASLRQAALRAKALETIVAECRCTYHHETPAEAHVRVAHMRAEQEEILREMGAAPGSPSSQDGSAGSRSHLKLV